MFIKYLVFCYEKIIFIREKKSIIEIFQKVKNKKRMPIYPTSFKKYFQSR